MKSLLITLVFILASIAVKAQSDKPRPVVDFFKDFDPADPILIGEGELTLVTAVRFDPDVELDGPKYYRTDYEIGIGLLYGDRDFSSSHSGLLGFIGNSYWEYCEPFVSIDMRQLTTWATEEEKSRDFPIRNFVAPVMLNFGVNAGIGDTDIFFAGIGGNIGISTDFTDTYLRMGLGFDLMGMTLGFGTHINLTNHGMYSNYLDGINFEIRYTLWRDY